MDKSRQSVKHPCTGTAVLVTAIALSAWSGSALSAASTEIECDPVVRDIKSLDIPLENLGIHTVDHVAIEPERSDLDQLIVTDDSAETAAPFLFLTPRVASVLRDIFDATQESAGLKNGNDVASSPVAETEVEYDVNRLFDEVDPESSANENHSDLPLFQQRMFRTDI